jgi:hypothetical protein
VSPWSHCPGPEVTETPGGDLQLEVSEQALYCVIPGSPGPDAATMFASLARLLVLEGSYPVPSETGTYPTRLPLCVELANEAVPPSLGDVGELEVLLTSGGVGEFLRAWLRQPMVDETGGGWTAGARIIGTYESELKPVRVDGTSGLDTSNWHEPVTFTLQSPQDQWERSLHGCGSSPDPTEVVEVEFPAGSTEMEVEVVSIVVAGGVPIGFLRKASGQLQGENFSQTNYWDLVYVGGHHGWVNDYFVRFDRPVADVCGLWITYISCCEPDEGATVRLLGCDLSVTEEQRATGVNVTRL